MKIRTVRDTSITTYHDILDEGWIGEAQEKVYKAIIDNPNSTDREIANLLSYPDPNKVRPRRKELLDMTLIKDNGTRECSVTNRTAHMWIVNERPDMLKIRKKMIKIKCPYCKGKGFTMIEAELFKQKALKDFFKE
jgi:hypothetical protein